MQEDNKVQVIIRVRPLTNTYAASAIAVNSDSQKRCIRSVRDEKAITLDTKDSETFTFDFIAGE